MKLTRESLEKSLELLETYIRSDYTGTGFDQEVIKELVQAHLEALKLIKAFNMHNHNGDVEHFNCSDCKARECLSKTSGVE